MYDQGQKKPVTEKAARTGASVGESERRNANRHVVIASAEVVELASGARFSTRTTDLGPGGCFVDTMVPFPVGSKVNVNIRKGRTNFESTGVVVYSQSGLGMGIAFDSMEAHQREALDVWLLELTGERQAPAHTAPSGSAYASRQGEQSSPYEARLSGAAPARRQTDLPVGSSAAMTRLVRLLIGKGLLTEAEGTSILHEPVI
jgi:hypothetical protein